MKKPLAATLIALPLLTLSSVSFAAEPKSAVEEPMVLSQDQLDGITAARRTGPPAWAAYSYNNLANITQINVSPVTIVQIGNYNTAVVYSGNFLWLNQ